MTLLDILAYVFGACGFAFGVRCYAELWKWAKQCQNAKIAIAHKRKVQINAPLAEWLTWANMLSKDESVNGRVVYRNGHVSVAIYRPSSKRNVLDTIKNARKARKGKVPA